MNLTLGGGGGRELQKTDFYKGITPEDSQTLKLSAVTFVETLNKNSVLYAASLIVSIERLNPVCLSTIIDHVLCSKIDSRPCRILSNIGK
jgi:hypothetical protein